MNGFKLLPLVVLMLAGFAPAQEAASSNYQIETSFFTIGGSVTANGAYEVMDYIGLGHFGAMKNMNFLIGPSTAVQGRYDAEIPQSFALQQNIPNPFNAQTRVVYDVPEVCNVSIEVYSILGRRVRTLVDGPQVPGRYILMFDGRDQYQRPLASGVYLLRMQAPSFHATVSILLVR